MWKRRGGSAISAVDEEQIQDNSERSGRIRNTVYRMLQTDKYAPDTEEVEISCATWNVGECPPVASMEEWLGVKLRRPDIIAVSLQEVDMSMRSLASETSQKGSVWLQNLHQQLGGTGVYKVLSPMQVVGLMLIVFVRSDISHEVRHVSSDVLRQGKGGRIGNKAGIGMRFSLRGRSFCFISVHLVPNEENWAKRNESFEHLMSELSFETSIQDDAVFTLQAACHTASVTDSRKKKVTVACHDYVVFFGDLNYRLVGISENEAKRRISLKQYTSLMAHDQLARTMKTGESFEGFCEAPIDFPPTYKYERGTDEYACSLGDEKGKKRIPAYCDRVLFHSKNARGTRLTCESYTRHEMHISDHRPVHASLRASVWCLSPTAAQDLLSSLWATSESIEMKTWSRRWFSRYLSPDYSTFVTSHGLPQRFRMQEASECDPNWRDTYLPQFGDGL
eukprot:TRINITY_DN17266_c0_g1_i1.p1 TRINITY_DN17266_c0_g1~~TRINITY_DN17266_c0_g1_i1.p1  ORF type:complete len:449 (+),score=59.14 TRINITY_DN17266_c0_g1_i1:43-1389(+)